MNDFDALDDYDYVNSQDHTFTEEWEEEMYYLLGEDDELFDEFMKYVCEIEEELDYTEQQWVLEWTDRFANIHHDTEEFIESIMALQEITVDPDCEISDHLYRTVREVAAILEPLQDPHLMMDEDGEVHEDD